MAERAKFVSAIGEEMKKRLPLLIDVWTAQVGAPKSWDAQELGISPIRSSQTALAVDANRVLYIADWIHHRVVKVAPKGDVRPGCQDHARNSGGWPCEPGETPTLRHYRYCVTTTS